MQRGHLPADQSIDTAGGRFAISGSNLVVANGGLLNFEQSASHAVTEDEMLELEREAFISLCGEPLSQARMQYFLQNKKPLRN